MDSGNNESFSSYFGVRLNGGLLHVICVKPHNSYAQGHNPWVIMIGYRKGGYCPNLYLIYLL